MDDESDDDDGGGGELIMDEWWSHDGFKESWEKNELNKDGKSFVEEEDDDGWYENRFDDENSFDVGKRTSGWFSVGGITSGGGGGTGCLDGWPMIDRPFGLNDDEINGDVGGEESNCCRWSLKPSIFGCVNAHFSQSDVSHSRQ
jgi:hypothetical protein